MNERARFTVIAISVAAAIAVMTYLVTRGDTSTPKPVPTDSPAAETAPQAAAEPPPAAPRLLAGAIPAQAPPASPIRTPAAPEPQNRHAMIAGWVLYEDGRPAPNIPVAAHWTPHAEPALRGAPTPVFQIQSDEGGRFAFDRLGDGFYILNAVEGELTAAEFAPVFDGRKIDVVLVLKPAADIRGRVLDAQGAPVPGAAVHVMRSDLAAKQPSLSVPSTSTGGDGAFHLRGLPEGAVRLLAEAEGLPSVLTEPIDPGASGVTIVLQGGATLAGQTVDAQSGAPAGGVRMILVPDAMRHRGLELRSDPGGAFRIDGLVPGLYALRVVDPQVVLPAPIERLELGTDAENHITVPVVPAGEIRGRVVIGDTDHKPAPGVVVTARRYDGLTHGEPRTYRAAPSNADGAFQIAGLPHGVYEIAADPAGRLFAATPRRIRLDASQRIEDLRIPMYEGLTVRGRVVTAGGEPAPGAVVHIANAVDRHRRVTADENGAFEALGVIPLEQTQAFAEWGAFRSDPAAVPFGPSGPGEVLLRLTAERTMPNRNREPSNEPVGLRTVDAPGQERPVASGPFEIRGEVRNDGGEPVAGALVGERGRNSPAVTDARGRFTLQGLAEGPHQIHASHPDAGTGSTVAEAGARGIVIALVPHDFRGRVADAATGAPITRFSVGIGGQITGLARTTPDILWFDDPQGRFVFVPRRRMGLDRAELVVAADGYAQTRIEAVPGQETVVELDRGRRIAGRVVDEADRPVAGAFIYENAPPTAFGAEPYKAVAADDGQFLLDGVGNDVRAIAAQRPGFADGSAQLPARGDVENLVIRLGAGTDLEVRVDAGPWPKEAVVVSLYNEAAPFPLDAKPLDAEGVARFQRLAPEPVTVRIDSALEFVDAPDGRWTIEIPFDIRPQGSNRIEAAFPPLDAAVRGQINPVAAITPQTEVIAVYRDERGRGEFRTKPDADGAYRFDALPPGQVRLRLSPGDPIGELVPLQSGQAYLRDLTAPGP